MAIARFASAAALIATLTISPTFAALPASQCNALFKRADRNHDGSLSGNEARMYLSVMTRGPIKPRKIIIITRSDFDRECRKGSFDNFAGRG